MSDNIFCARCDERIEAGSEHLCGPVADRLDALRRDVRTVARQLVDQHTLNGSGVWFPDLAKAINSRWADLQRIATSEEPR